MNEGVSFGGYRLEHDLCCAIWSVAKDRLDLLQPIFYSHDAGRKGHLLPGEMRAMLRRLEPEAPDRQLDRVEAMVSAAEQFATKATAVPVGSSGGFALHGVTLDAFVRAVHGGATAAARLATPEGCAAAAQLVGHLESAVMASPDVFHRALSSVVARGNLPARRRVMLHRAMLQIVPRALMPQMVARGDIDAARLLIASLDSPAGVHGGTGPGDALASDANMLPARLRSLRSELIQASALMSSSSYPSVRYQQNTGGRLPYPQPYFASRTAVVAPERITAAAKGVQELDEAYRRFRALEQRVMGGVGPGTGLQTPEQVLDEVKKQVGAAVAAAGDAEKKANAHLDRYYQWTYAQRSQILAYWADSDTKRREAAALKLSKEKEAKAKSGKEAADKAATEATAAMKAMELEMKKNVVLHQTAVKKEMGLLEAEIKKIVAYNKDTLVMPPKPPADADRKETVSKSLDVALAEAAQRTAHARQAAATLAPYTPTPSTLALGPLVVGGPGAMSTAAASGGGGGGQGGNNNNNHNVVVNAAAVPLVGVGGVGGFLPPGVGVDEATQRLFEARLGLPPSGGHQHGAYWPGAMGGYAGFGSAASSAYSSSLFSK